MIVARGYYAEIVDSKEVKHQGVLGGIVGKFPCQIILLHSSVQTSNLVLLKCTNLEDFLLTDTQIQSVKNLLNPGIKSEYLW